MDYEAEVKKVWPDARLWYRVSYEGGQHTLAAVRDEGDPHAPYVSDWCKDGDEAFKNAYSKLPAPSTTSEPTIGAREFLYDFLALPYSERLNLLHKHGIEGNEGPEQATQDFTLDSLKILKARGRIEALKVDTVALTEKRKLEGWDSRPPRKSIPPPTIGSEGAFEECPRCEGPMEWKPVCVHCGHEKSETFRAWMDSQVAENDEDYPSQEAIGFAEAAWNAALSKAPQAAPEAKEGPPVA